MRKRTALLAVLVGVILGIVIGAQGAKAQPIRWHKAIASWYQLTGSQLGCPPYDEMRDGQLGVAHKSLPCGAKVRLRYRGRYVTVPVIDRGPATWTGRQFDLTAATRERLGYVTDTTLYWRRVR